MRHGQPIIDATTVMPLQTAWGTIDLRKLNDLTQYAPDTGAFEVARDLELAHVLGLIRIKRMDAGMSPMTVRRAFSERFTAVPSVSWYDWALLGADSRALATTGALTVGPTLLTYTLEPTTHQPRFTVNGEPVSPEAALRQFLESHDLSGQFFALSVLPRLNRQTFGWRYPHEAGAVSSTATPYAEKLKTLGLTDPRLAQGVYLEVEVFREQLSYVLQDPELLAAWLDPATQGVGIVKANIFLDSEDALIVYQRVTSQFRAILAEAVTLLPLEQQRLVPAHLRPPVVLALDIEAEAFFAKTGLSRRDFLAIVPASWSIPRISAHVDGRPIRTLTGDAPWVQRQRATAPSPEGILPLAFHPSDGTSINPTGLLLIATVETSLVTNREHVQTVVAQRRLTEDAAGVFWALVIPVTPAVAEAAEKLRAFKESLGFASVKG